MLDVMKVSILVGAPRPKPSKPDADKHSRQWIRHCVIISVINMKYLSVIHVKIC